MSGDAPMMRGPTTTRVLPGNEPDAIRNSRQSLVLTSRDIRSESGQRLPLNISIRRKNDITVESIKLVGLPAGYVLGDSLRSVRSDESGENLDVTGWDTSSLWIAPPDKRSEHFWLSLVVVWKWKSSGSIEVTMTDFSVEVSPNLGSRGISTGALLHHPRLDENGQTPSHAIVPLPPGPASPEPQMSKSDITSMRDADTSVTSKEARAPPPAPKPSSPAQSTDVRSFVARAKDLIARGDISGAQLFLERARARKEPDATFLLAQTWDPKMLRQWNVRGLRPDPERARALYDEASKGETTDERLRSAKNR